MTLYVGLPDFCGLEFKDFPLADGDVTFIHLERLKREESFQNWKFKKIVSKVNDKSVDLKRVPYFNSMHLLYSFDQTYASVGNCEKLIKFVSDRNVERFTDPDVLLNHVAQQNELSYWRDGSPMKRVIVSKRKQYNLKNCVTIHPKDVSEIGLFNNIVMIDINSLSFKELFNVLLYCNDHVYFDGFNLSEVFCETVNCNVPDDVFGIFMNACFQDFKSLRVFYVYENKPYVFKKNNPIENVCHICKNQTNSVKAVKSYCRITDELENMDFICDSCYRQHGGSDI